MQVRQVLAMSVCFVTAHSCLQFRNSDAIQGCAGGETGHSDIHDILHVKAERSETSVCQKAKVVKKEKWESLRGWLKTNEFQRPGGSKYYIHNYLLCEFVWERAPATHWALFPYFSFIQCFTCTLFLYQWRTCEMMIFFFDSSACDNLQFTFVHFGGVVCLHNLHTQLPVVKYIILFDSPDKKKNPNTLSSIFSLLHTCVTVL